MLFTAMTTPLATVGLMAGLFSCPELQPAEINVTFHMENMQVDNSRSHADLQGMSSNTISPTYSNDFAIVNGLTNSEVKATATTSFQSTSNSIMRKGCMWIDKVDVVMDYAPIVYIASNYPTDSCHYNETMKHELKHVNADIQTTNEFLPYIKKMTADMAERMASNQPFELEATQGRQNILAESISKAVSKATDDMYEVLKSRQRQIDSREEYEQLSRACPNEPNM